MKGSKSLNARMLSVVGFSFFSVYILSFLFEGQVLYSLLDLHGTDVSGYILASIIAHFIGLLTCGLFVRSRTFAKNMLLGGMGLCLVTAIPFFNPFRLMGREPDHRWVCRWLYHSSMGIFSQGFYTQE